MSQTMCTAWCYRSQCCTLLVAVKNVCFLWTLSFFMDLHIVSWNINGLHSSRESGSRKLLLRHDLHRHVVGDMDILFVQSTSFPQLLPSKLCTFWGLVDGLMSRSKGVSISIGPHQVSYICDHGMLVASTCIWLSMQIHDQFVELLCVCASTDPRLRVDFWHDIVNILLVVDSWLVGGDFNHLESTLIFMQTLLLCFKALLLSQRLMHRTISFCLETLVILGKSLLLCTLKGLLIFHGVSHPRMVDCWRD